MSYYAASDIFAEARTYSQAKHDMAKLPLALPYFAYSSNTLNTLLSLRKGEWEGRGKTYAMVPPIVWETTNTSERTAYFEMNALVPVISALTQILTHEIPDGPLNSDEQYLLALLLDWAQHGFYDAESFVQSRIVFRWYDMAVGCRVSVLVYFLQRVAQQDGEKSLEVFTLLAQQLHSHYLALIDERFWTKHSNHGLFQAIGLYNIALCMKKYLNREMALHTGISRIQYFFQQGYSVDGFWLEHSPGYHNTIHDIIQPLCATDALPAPFANFLKKLALRSLHALSWFIQPDKTLALLGDTLSLPSLHGHPAENVVYDGHYTSQAAGYAFYRKDTAKPETSTYFCFCASFHANVHKHLDDLSFVWWSRGIPLAIDSGMYMYNGEAPDIDFLKAGFRYNDPMRMYVESNRAHNTIEIDETPDFRIKSNFYGSGILASEMVHDKLFAISGQVHRHSQFVHTRHMLVHADGWILIVDTLNKEAASRSLHTFDQWFTLDPALRPVTTQTPHAVSFEAERGTLHIHSLTQAKPELFCGQTQPFYAGWYCPQNNKVPTHALRYRQTGSEALMVTLLTFDSVTQSHMEYMPDGNLRVQWETPSQSMDHIFKAVPSKGALFRPPPSQ